MSTMEIQTGQAQGHQDAAGAQASPFKSPDDRIAALEQRIKEDRLRSRAEALELETNLAERKRARSRRRHAWQFVAGLALGIAGTLLISASINQPAQAGALGPTELAASLGEAYVGPPFECKAEGGGFECFQPTASGGVTLQVRLDYRGCWEAKPNGDADVATANSGCIGDAPKPGGSG
jgi:hypothetical protein